MCLGAVFNPCLGIELSFEKILLNLNLNPQPGEEKRKMWGQFMSFQETEVGSATPGIKVEFQPSKGAFSAKLTVNINFILTWEIHKFG